MEVTQPDEKLLTGTEAEKFLPAGLNENFPLQNAKEFLTRTPVHELKNVFGISPDVPPALEKETPKTELPKSARMEPEKPRHPFAKFLGGFLLLLLLVTIGLYIWGAILAV